MTSLPLSVGISCARLHGARARPPDQDPDHDGASRFALLAKSFQTLAALR